MSGIAGIWGRGRRADPLLVLEAMQQPWVHRGPDASGSWVDEGRGIGLGHRRLAVVGLGDAGAQPMHSRSERWVITYNGELYNGTTLRARLAQSGTRFRGSSDTEVLVEALEAWGPATTLERIEGMFAFAAYDRQEHRLILARDRMGEKPLVYGHAGSTLVFASELQALRTVDGFDASVDPDAVALFLRFKCVPAPCTIHPGTLKLPPGHWLEISDPTDPPDPKPYWDFASVVEAGARDQYTSDAEAIEQLDHTLAEAVRRQLRSDVPLGAFLSGGIDSALIATLAAEQLDRPLKTFTIGSPEADLDERPEAQAIAERLGADHTELVVTPADALATVPTLAGHWDEPFADSSQLPMLLAAGLARQQVTVAFSGDGGDELFGGYNRHRWLPRAWKTLGKVPDPVRQVAAAGLRLPSPHRWDRMAQAIPDARRPRMFGLKVEKLASMMDVANPADGYTRLVSHWQDPLAVVPGARDIQMLAQQGDRWPAAATLAEQLMAVDALTYMPDDVLVKVDRATMAHSLESRAPFLSPEVVELSCRLPLDIRIRNGNGKWILRELLAKRHPRSMFDRPKSGFGIPIASWLREGLRPWSEDLLSESSLRSTGLLDPAPIRQAWTEHQSGRRDRSYELWDVLMLVSWMASVQQ